MDIWVASSRDRFYRWRCPSNLHDKERELTPTTDTELTSTLTPIAVTRTVTATAPVAKSETLAA